MGDLSGAQTESSSRASRAATRSGLVPPAKQQLARSMGSPAGKACVGSIREASRQHHGGARS